MSDLTIKQRLYKRYWQILSRWLDKRQPATNEVTLTHKLIFILPTPYGLWFILLICLLYLLGTNYQNNLILLLGYLLLSVFLLSILLCFNNLRGLTFRPQSNTIEGYASSQLMVAIELRAKNPCHMFSLNFITQPEVILPFLSGNMSDPVLNTHAFSANANIVNVPLQLTHRGCFTLPRLRVISRYPFGLWRCWSYIALAQPYWVYPEPREPNAQPASSSVLPDNLRFTETGDTLTEYRPGDSLRQLVWKRLAREPEKPVVRQPTQASISHPQWVVVPPSSGLTLEQALSHACYQLLELERRGSQYGLQLPAKTIPQAKGAMHLQRCLQELALC